MMWLKGARVGGLARLVEECAGGYEEEQIRSTFEGRVGSRSRNSECVCVSESG